MFYTQNSKPNNLLAYMTVRIIMQLTDILTSSNLNKVFKHPLFPENCLWACECRCSFSMIGIKQSETLQLLLKVEKNGGDGCHKAHWQNEERSM